MPVLYGVFLYMGASSLRGIQVNDLRLILFNASFLPTSDFVPHEVVKMLPNFTFHMN